MIPADPPPAHEFRELVLRAQAGDVDAMDHLLALARPTLSRIAQRYADPARPDESTSDLVQEAWLRAWQGLPNFHGGISDAETRAKFQAWVTTIARRIGLNACRSRDTEQRSPRERAVLRLDQGHPDTSMGSPLAPEAHSPPPSAAARQDEETMLVRRALEAIPDDTIREVVRLRFFEELPLARIAERLKLTYDQARYRFEEGLKVLERALEELG